MNNSIHADPSQTVLVLSAQQEPEFEMLHAIPHLVGNKPASFAAIAKDVEILFSWAASRDLLRETFLMCPKLRWIHSRSAGLDGKLFPELVQSSVVLTNGTGVFSASLGEFTLATILYFAKDMARMRKNQQAGIWDPFDVQDIAGQSVGIIGYGDIGRAVAVRAHAMGMSIFAHKRHLPSTPDPFIDRYFLGNELHEMLPLCDYVVVAAPLTEETRHMVGEKEFARMKPSAVFINVGRGAIVDEAAMLRALTTGTIKGAGLDVFEQEPLPPHHPLYSMENVFLSPHCADNTPQWKANAMQFFFEQLARFKKNEPLLNIVDKRLGY